MTDAKQSDTPVNPFDGQSPESRTTTMFAEMLAEAKRLGAMAERQRCADIANALDSGRGNEAEIARAILVEGTDA
jgi:hypothetical protein